MASLSLPLSLSLSLSLPIHTLYVYIYTGYISHLSSSITRLETVVEMAIRGNTALLVLLFSFLFVATVTWADVDPELQQCKRQCGVQHQSDKRQKQECEQRCERQAEEKKRREEEGSGRGGGRDNKRDPEEQIRRCKEECQRRTEGREQLRQCERVCEKTYREEERKGGGNPRYEGSEEESEGRGQQQSSGPYVFEDQHFTARAESQHGRIRVLQKFTERSELLRGIENYRVAILETEPQTFVLPNHWDAEGVFFVAQGRGAITLVHQDRRESLNLRYGDIVRIPAGTTVYLINKSNNEKLVIIKLLQPVSIPGEFVVFSGPGGEDPESYFSAFSSDLLEAALNTKRDKIQRLFGQQQGVIVKASEEQIRSLSHHEEGGGSIWPFGGDSKRVLNLFHKHPTQSNQYGQLYEVDPNDCRDLRELNLAVAFANFTGGSMTAPYYNSKATKIAVVTNGEGYFEMACPHLTSFDGSGRERQEGGGGSQQQRKSSPRYQKVSGRLRRGVVFVVPAGHPVITVASKNQNLQIISFDVNAKNNEKFPLAGRRNIINRIEREAKELAFNVPAKEVDEVFRNQQEEFFFEGPRQQQEGRAYA